MAGLQRSAVSFRRQGSSGIVWDDRFLSELSQMKPEQQQEGDGETTKQIQLDEQGQHQQQQQQQDNNPEKNDVVKPTRNAAPPIKIERSRSSGEKRGYRTGKVSPDTEPPSPKVSACGFCTTAFGKKQDKIHRKKPGKRRSR